MTIEKDFFRQVMGHFATGVAIATTISQGKPSGLTVNSFTSLSLDPPLVLICVDKVSNTLPLFRDSKIFAVNFLTTKQVHLSRCFATPSEDRFEHFCHVPYYIAATGAPILNDILAFVDTRLVAEYPGGDHVIFVGEVEAMGTTNRTVFTSKEGRVRSTLMNDHEYATNASNDTILVEEAAPLVYYRGQYRYLANYYSEPSLDDAYSAKVKSAEER